MLVACAAAQVSFEAVAYLFARWRGVSFEQLRGGDDHAGRAVAALKAVSLPEAFLDGMQFAVCGETFNRLHFSAVGLHGEKRARLHSLSVNQHGARAAQR